MSLGSSTQNGSALKREFSGGSYKAKRQPLPSPSEGSLSSGGVDQGSDAPTRDYDGEVSVTALGKLWAGLGVFALVILPPAWPQLSRADIHPPPGTARLSTWVQAAVFPEACGFMMTFE